jgi:penicillin-binding protein 1A
VLFMIALLFFTALAGVAYLLVVQLKIPNLNPELDQTSYLLDANGDRLATLNAGQDRQLVKLDQVPPVLIDAVLASEDQHFFEHSGLDPVGILRATWNDVRNHGGGLQGGSTITQQYVKNTYLGSERTVWRKVKEAALAVKLERKLDKREILERYLNTIYFGRGAYGVQAAARSYFQKDVGEIDLRESAYLAGLIRAPELADAKRAPDVADRRRNKVLANMVTTKKITVPQRNLAAGAPVSTYVIDRAKRDPIVLNTRAGTDYFVDYVTRMLKANLGEKALSAGLRVTTTLDVDTQRQAYSAVYGQTLTRVSDPAGALVAVDDRGRIRAMVGGRNWNLPPEDCVRQHCKVNLAVGKEGGGSGRQPGSTFKPVLLAETVREGYSVESSFAGPAHITLPKANNGDDWKVSNFDDADFGAHVNLVDATRNSVNTVYAQLAVDIGATKMRSMAESLGVSAHLRAVNSLVLGTGEVSVLDMATVFSTFANRGERITPTPILRIETADGRVIENHERPQRTRVLTKEQADVVNFCLRQVVERGSGTGAQVAGKSIIGKTGTTQDFADAWFVGATSKLTAAVWMGYPEGNAHKMTDVRGRRINGGSLPATIFKRFMTPASRGATLEPFATPSSFPGRILNTRVPFVTTPPPASSTSRVPGASSTTRPSPTSTAPAGTVPAPTSTAPPATTSSTQPHPPTTKNTPGGPP